MNIASAVRRLEVESDKFLERRDGTRTIGDFDEYRDDPVGFCRDVLDEKLWWRQVEIAELLMQRNQVCVVSCNSAGKDHLAAALGLWFVYARGGLVLLTGPTERQVKGVLMERIRAAFTRAGDLRGDLFEMSLRVEADGMQAGIIGATATDSSRLTGFHSPGGVFSILTEAQGLGSHAFEGMLACGTGAGSKILALGNPLEGQGRFWQCATSDSWATVRIPASDHPNWDAAPGHEPIPGGPTRQWAASVADFAGGVETPIYQARVLAKFPEQDTSDVLCARIWLEEAASIDRRLALEKEAAFEVACVGLDVARLGGDQTILCVREGPILRHLLPLPAAQIDATVDLVDKKLRELGYVKGILSARLKGTAFERKKPRVVVDAVGLGAGVADYLERGGWAVERYQGSETPKTTRNAKTYLNRRAEDFMHLRFLLERGLIALVEDEYLNTELCALKWKVDAQRDKVRMEPKDDLRSRIGRSADRADAIAMCFSSWREDLTRAVSSGCGWVKGL